MSNYNVVVVKEDGKVVRASLAVGVWVDDGQSTIVCKSDTEAAELLKELEGEGAFIPPRSKSEAEKILGN